MHRVDRYIVFMIGSLLLPVGASCTPEAPPPTRPAPKPQPQPKASPKKAAPAWFTALVSGADPIPAAASSLTEDVSFTWMDSGEPPITGRAAVTARLRQLALRLDRLTLRGYETAHGAVLEGTLVGVNAGAPDQITRFAMVMAGPAGKRKKITLYASPVPIPRPPGLETEAPGWTFGERSPALEARVRAAWGRGLVGIAHQELVFVNAATGQINQGSHTLKAAQEAHAARFNEAACPIAETISLGDRVWVRSTCSGVYRGNVGKKGARVTIHLLDALVFEGGQLASLTSYANPSIVAKQLNLKTSEH